MTDLETRVRDTLTDHAESTGPWMVSGDALRASATRRRSRRRRIGAAAVAACAVATSLTLTAPGADRPDRGPSGQRTSTPSASVSPPQPESAWRSVELTDAMWSKVIEVAGGSATWAPLVTTALAGSGDVIVLIANNNPTSGSTPIDALSVMTVTVSRSGDTAVSGTSGRYPSLSSVVAQPVRVGDRALLLVLLPTDLGDTVQVTTSRPGNPPQRSTAFVKNRLALVPVTAPQEITRLQVLRAGRTVVDTIPAGSHLGADVPRTLERVIASDGPPTRPQGVQVRTDGATACRMTVGGWWEGTPLVEWNPFDAGCGPVDGHLHLLLADDRRYSSVAGIVPVGATSVRLTWRSGSDTDVTETPVRNPREGVRAFIDTSGHRPDQLTRAEALDSRGTVLESVQQ